MCWFADECARLVNCSWSMFANIQDSRVLFARPLWAEVGLKPSL